MTRTVAFRRREAGSPIALWVVSSRLSGCRSRLGQSQGPGVSVLAPGLPGGPGSQSGRCGVRAQGRGFVCPCWTLWGRRRVAGHWADGVGHRAGGFGRREGGPPGAAAWAPTAALSPFQGSEGTLPRPPKSLALSAVPAHQLSPAGLVLPPGASGDVWGRFRLSAERWCCRLAGQGAWDALAGNPRFRATPLLGRPLPGPGVSRVLVEGPQTHSAFVNSPGLLTWCSGLVTLLRG